ncbi:tubulin-specific chaperone C [Achlya hypogyna]|uniref:Tubulin-specific chaperone C n=1 Tax=Achlya hypogyna TaxID=1202772 RepID=A0A1V9ZJD4_ACHHY|nr:tubulin-specific chaperone C [Achlya hypogyna]
MLPVVGQRCEISGKRRGEVAYVGSVEGIPAGDWVGIRLDLPFGKHDGSQSGRRYFDAPALHGVFVRPENVNTSEAFPPLLVVADDLSLEEKVRVVEDARAAQRASSQAKAAASEKDTRATAVDGFWKRFTDMEADARAALDRSESSEPSPAVRSELDAIVTCVQAMRDAAADASLYLPPYDIRQSQAIVARLLAEIDAQRSALAPRKKFAFKARVKRAAAASVPATSPQPVADIPSAPVDHELVIADKRDELVVIDAVDTPDLTLARLTNCVVCIVAPTAAVRATALTSCHVLTGPILGSLWLEECIESSFTVACRQLRVHHCHRSTFYLRIKSHPIIEDCSALGFGPYALAYPALATQLADADMAAPSPLFAQVHDFKWHRAQQSPNWYVLSESARHPLADDPRIAGVAVVK